MFKAFRGVSHQSLEYYYRFSVASCLWKRRRFSFWNQARDSPVPQLSIQTLHARVPSLRI